jgi:hypothetical protein
LIGYRHCYRPHFTAPQSNFVSNARTLFDGPRRSPPDASRMVVRESLCFGSCRNAFTIDSIRRRSSVSQSESDRQTFCMVPLDLRHCLSSKA